MRRLMLLAALALAFGGCSSAPPDVRVVGGCAGPDASCARYVPAVDMEGAPLPRASVLIPFSGPVRVAALSAPLHAVTAAFDFETRTAALRLVPVRSISSDAGNARQVVIELDGLLADGAAIEIPEGVITDTRGRGAGSVKVTVATPHTPLGIALSAVVWEPSDPSLFSLDGIRKPRGEKAEAPVRGELESSLRARPRASDALVHEMLARYDSEAAKRKIPDHRVRAGLLTLTGTTAEPAINFILSDTNRRGVPFEAIEVVPLAAYGALAAVQYHPLIGKLRMMIDTDVAADALENIGIELAHEAVHSSLASGSATEETLAKAVQARVYQEFLQWNPGLASLPSAGSRTRNVETLALRNSGRFGFPNAGVLPRPGVEDAVRGTGHEPARSFRDMLFQPDWYGDLPRAGDTGTEVVEGYYRRMIGSEQDQGRLKLDQDTLKLFDRALDHGFTDAHIVAVIDALKLRPVPVANR